MRRINRSRIASAVGRILGAHAGMSCHADSQPPTSGGSLRVSWPSPTSPSTTRWTRVSMRPTRPPRTVGQAQNLDAYSSYDRGLGAVKDAWTVELYGENLTDVRAAQTGCGSSRPTGGEPSGSAWHKV
jgi:hypothetical protein